MKAIEAAFRHTSFVVDSLRQGLSEKVPDDGFSVVLGGSYARGEASSESDLDFYIVAEPHAVEKAEEFLPVIKSILTTKLKPPGEGGPFGTVHSSDVMRRDIGGDGDENKKFTVRMLFLTEGEWLSNQKTFKNVRRSLIERYIQPGIKTQQLGRFFLNDVIRYYRTICVDFENKTFENNKAWGPRNIKLVFSRKLLYVSGVLVAAELSGLPYENKLTRMSDLLDMPPLKRIEHICGSESKRVFEAYNYFLEQFSQATVRSAVAKVIHTDNSRETNEVFRALKDHSHNFSRALIELINSKYDAGHGIHEALLM